LSTSPLQLLKSLFVNRTDCYCIQLQTGGYSKISEPLTDAKLQEHLDGETTIGTYQLNSDSLVKWFCFDLDPEKLADPQATAKQILATMRTRGEDKKPIVWDNAIILEASRYPDNSYHIWVTFTEATKAKIARWIAQQILKKAGLSPKLIEVFPKQDELTPERPYGNFVKLPFGKHQVEQKYSRLLDLDTFQPQPLEHLTEKTGLTISEIDAATIEQLLSRSNKQTTFTAPTNTRDITAKDSDRLVEFLAKYWVNGYRNELVLSFCGMCIKEGKTHQSTREVIAKVCDVTATSNYEKAEFLSKVDYQFANRRTIGNLKGISGLREVIRAVNQHAETEEAIPPC
jgi:hypothetical protein